MHIKSVLFDLDGTLTDPFVGISASIKYALNKMNRPIPDDKTLGEFIGPPLPVSFSKHCGMTAEEAEKALSLYREYYHKDGVYALNVYDGVIDMLKSLKAVGKRLYIATSKPEKFAEMIADKFGFSEYLDGVAGASFDLSRNEKADVIRYALERFGIEKEHAIMVGDRNYDVFGAKENGMDCIGVLYGYGSKDEFNEALCAVETPQAVAEKIINIG
ncbi:MAG: HAD hydrolase-like protein [Clostridiales bacterium]|nr:HAD hydrolase-like protein [Clostridiales bacterium]